MRCCCGRSASLRIVTRGGGTARGGEPVLIARPPPDELQAHQVRDERVDRRMVVDERGVEIGAQEVLEVAAHGDRARGVEAVELEGLRRVDLVRMELEQAGQVGTIQARISPG
jgi:hypothetical protein